MPPRGRGRGGSAPMGRIPSSGSATQQQQQEATEEPAKKAPPMLTPYQVMQRKALLIPPLYPEVTIRPCKPITIDIHTMIEQMRNSRGRIRNSPYYIDTHHCEASLDEKKDPLLQSLGIKTGYFPSEIVVRPSKKRLMMLYRFNSGSEESNVQRLEKLFKQKKDEDDDDDDDDENADILAEDEESDGGDAYDAFENFDDDEDYLDEEEVGDGDEGPTM